MAKEGSQTVITLDLTSSQTNYITYRSRADDRRFYFNENDLGITGIISTYYPVFRIVDGVNKFFIELLAHHQETVGKYSVGTSQTVLSLPMLGRISLSLPTPSEQQKIAECLSSLDGLIAAEGRKLAALRDHKRGLMQQLFPQPGQTQPRLRFLEFRDKGEWVEAKLGQLGKLISGLTYSPEDVRDRGLLVLRSSNIQDGKIALDDCVYVTPTIKGAHLAKPNDILICVRNGSKPLIGKSAMIPEGIPKCTHGAFMTVLRANAAFFVFQLLQTSDFQRQVEADLGATINSINSNNLLRYRFFVPTEPLEQKQIADCLTVLDAQITAQAAKIDALKTHKRGLMQQLFPAPEEQ